MNNTETLKNIELLKNLDTDLAYLCENEANLTDNDIQIELNNIRNKIKNLAV